MDDPAKRWKFAKGDLDERQRWPQYMAAWRSVEQNQHPWAPWYIIPANRKWYRNLVISQIIVETLEGLAMSYPAAEAGLEKLVIE